MMRVPFLIGRVAKAPRPWIFERRNSKYLLGFGAADLAAAGFALDVAADVVRFRFVVAGVLEAISL